MRPYSSASFLSVIAWGAGEDGQLGLGENDDKDSPHVVTALESISVRSVVGGSRNSLAICHDGKLCTCGWNQRGTLGHPPETKSENTPNQVVALDHVKVVQLTFVKHGDGDIDDTETGKQQGKKFPGWGRHGDSWLGGNEYGQCGEEPELKADYGKHIRRDVTIPQRCVPNLVVSQVAAGGTHSVVLTREGHVWTWGQLWPPGDIKQKSVPVHVPGLQQIKVIATGAFHNLALQEDATLWAWGNNEYGQLGTGDTQPRSQPVRVEGLSGVHLVDIAAGGWHSTALTDLGEVYGWGRGEHGRLGLGDHDKSSKMLPQKIHLLAGEDVIQVSCGGTHSVALTRDGRLYSFGRGDNGRLGNGKKVTTGQPVEVPIDIPPPQPEDGQWRAKAIACGGRHTLAIVEWEKGGPI